MWSSKCPSCTHSLQPLLWCTVLNGVYNHKTVLAVSYRVPVSLRLDFHFFYYTTNSRLLHGSFIFASYVVLLSCGNRLSCISGRLFFLLTWATTENRSCLKLSMATVHCFWCLCVSWPISFPSTLPFCVLPGNICCSWPNFLVSCLYVSCLNAMLLMNVA